MSDVISPGEHGDATLDEEQAARLTEVVHDLDSSDYGTRREAEVRLRAALLEHVALADGGMDPGAALDVVEALLESEFVRDRPEPQEALRRARAGLQSAGAVGDVARRSRELAEHAADHLALLEASGLGGAAAVALKDGARAERDRAAAERDQAEEALEALREAKRLRRAGRDWTEQASDAWHRSSTAGALPAWGSQFPPLTPAQRAEAEDIRFLQGEQRPVPPAEPPPRDR